VKVSVADPNRTLLHSSIVPEAAFTLCSSLPAHKRSAGIGDEERRAPGVEGSWGRVLTYNIWVDCPRASP
jgi:hypothetical protein